MKAIKTHAIIGSISSRKDGSIRFSMETPELTADEKVAFMELQGKNLEAVLNPMDFQIKETVEVNSDLGEKTPSQRLRNILYVLWKEEGSKGQFRDYYEKKMEGYIDHIKTVLLGME